MVRVHTASHFKSVPFLLTKPTFGYDAKKNDRGKWGKDGDRGCRKMYLSSSALLLNSGAPSGRSGKWRFLLLCLFFIVLHRKIGARN